MHPYLLAPLVACLTSAICATAILARDPKHPTNRLAAAFVIACLFWSLCELFWNTADDPRVVIALVRLSALGWIFIGPLFLQLVLAVTGDSTPGLRRLVAFSYGVALVLLAVTWFTPWTTSAVRPTHWGWAYTGGPGLVVYNVLTGVLVSAAAVIGWRAYRRSQSKSERLQARWIAVGVLIPLTVASVTDGLLPVLDVAFPRFGTLSLASLGAIITTSIYQHGYSVLAPGLFAREIFETLPDGVALLRLDGRIRSTNQGLAELLGTSPAQLVDLPIGERLSVPILDRIGELHDVECELEDGNGQRLPVAVSTSPLRDKTGSSIGIVLVVRSLREVVDLRRRLVTSGRLAAVGQLAAGIAHEINNPLAFARSNLSVLRSEWAKLARELAPTTGDVADFVAEAEEMIDESLEGIDRAAAIVRDVRSFSHSGTGEGQLQDVHQVLRKVVRFAAPELGATRVVEVFGDVPPVAGSAQDLQQVFLNLVLNAAQAMRGRRGQIRLRTESGFNEVLVRVEDDGSGIPTQALDRIFDPFFTTKPVGEGTGLGLAISYEIVRRHGGDITVRSIEGKGTQFTVHLPLATS